MRYSPLLGLVFVACQATVSPQAIVAPGAVAAPEAQLEALVVPLMGGQVTFAECPYAPDEVPPLNTLKAPALPEFRADRSRDSNWENGEDRRDDAALSESLAPVQAQILGCLDLAACYVEGNDLVGEIAMQLEVTPEGRVRAVSVDVTEQLPVEPVVPCARGVLAQLQFPRINGGNTFVSYAVTID